MSKPAILVEGLSKEYRLGQGDVRTRTFGEALVSAASAPLRGLTRTLTRSHPECRTDTFRALDDVSFEVQPGDVVGVIGRNGAGKSTLLKVLSRITEPTRGKVRVRGRVASLLEVGTGFHPELSGRENVFLNGAILGMSRREIERKFAEIVAFAEVERFIDTPVKRYSSGMYLRLAFAVAAHLEPEILLVDEVLAVGDAAFQKRCMGRMELVAAEGRTVVFVSHNMAAIQALCRKAVWLHNGALNQYGSAPQVIEAYHSSAQSAVAGFTFSDSQPGPHISEARFSNPDSARPIAAIFTGDPIVLDFTVQTPESIQQVGVEFGISDLDGTRLYTTSTDLVYGLHADIPAGTSRFRCTAPALMLPAGRYKLDVALTKRGNQLLYKHSDYGLFEITERDLFGTGVPIRREWARVVLPHEWSQVAA